MPQARDDYPYQIEAELHLALLLRQLAELQRRAVAHTPADARAFTLLQARAKEMANLFRHAIAQAMERHP
jgi:class 3 adenylate cyclase